jgi:hypothetical protein
LAGDQRLRLGPALCAPPAAGSRPASARIGLFGVRLPGTTKPFHKQEQCKNLITET